MTERQEMQNKQRMFSTNFQVENNTQVTEREQKRWLMFGERHSMTPANRKILKCIDQAGDEFFFLILPTKEILEINVDHVLCATHVRSFLDGKFLPYNTPTFASAFNLKCCSIPLRFDSTFYFCFIKCDSNVLIYVIFNAAYSKDSKFMSKEEMFKTSGNFIGLQALLRIMIDLLQMSLCELYVIFVVVPTRSLTTFLNKTSGPHFT